MPRPQPIGSPRPRQRSRLRQRAMDRLREQMANLEQAAGDEAKAAALRLAAAEGATATATAGCRGSRQEVADLNQLLTTAETRVDEQQDQIDGLDEQLAQALAKKVGGAGAATARSSSAGCAGAGRPSRPARRRRPVRVPVRAAVRLWLGQLGPGRAGAAAPAREHPADVAARIPPGVDWILRVDGHTDRQPIRDAAFRSNWELSAARAISVIEFLIAQGHRARPSCGGRVWRVPPDRPRQRRDRLPPQPAHRVQADRRLTWPSTRSSSTAIPGRTTPSPCCWPWPRRTRSRSSRVTTVAGNVPLARTTANAQRIAGAGRPWRRAGPCRLPAADPAPAGDGRVRARRDRPQRCRAARARPTPVAKGHAVDVIVDGDHGAPCRNGHPVPDRAADQRGAGHRQGAGDRAAPARASC